MFDSQSKYSIETDGYMDWKGDYDQDNVDEQMRDAQVKIPTGRIVSNIKGGSLVDGEDVSEEGSSQSPLPPSNLSS